MPTERIIHTALIVSANDTLYASVSELLIKDCSFEVSRAQNAGDAKRKLMTSLPDILIINTPLPDDFGIELALDFSDSAMGVLLLVKSEYYEQVSYKAEKYGILTLGKPITKQGLYTAAKLLTAIQAKLLKLEKKNRSLREKMVDIRTVNRAKWLLIEHMNMTEKDAHYYIEKQAMDTRLSRREIAENIIRTYDT